jgi:hypothetical protein
MGARGLIWGPLLTITPAHGDAEIGLALEAARSSARVLRTLIDNRAAERVFDAERKRLGYAASTSEPAESPWGAGGRRESRPAGIPA